jgi:hypothetical protein
MVQLAAGSLVRHTATNRLALVVGHEPYQGPRLLYLDRLDDVVVGDAESLQVSAGPDDVRAVLRYLSDDVDA